MKTIRKLALAAAFGLMSLSAMGTGPAGAVIFQDPPGTIPNPIPSIPVPPPDLTWSYSCTSCTLDKSLASNDPNSDFSGLNEAALETDLEGLWSTTLDPFIGKVEPPANTLSAGAGFTGNAFAIHTGGFVLAFLFSAPVSDFQITLSKGISFIVTYFDPSRDPAPPPVPLPAAVWLFGSGLVFLAGLSRRRRKLSATASA